MTDISLLHFISLQNVGGLEKAYCEILKSTIKDYRLFHHTILTKKNISHILKKIIYEKSQSVHNIKYMFGIRIPNQPLAFRKLKAHHIAKKTSARFFLFWNNPSALQWSPYLKNSHLIYYEHGASWFKPKTPDVQHSLHMADRIICVSQAAKRMLEMRWDIPHEKIRVCLNAVRHDCVPVKQEVKPFPKDRPLTIGFAGRLEDVKGVTLTLYTLAEIMKRNRNVRLIIAGSGSKKNTLHLLAQQLKVQEKVTFSEFITKMSDFYNSIDILLCPSLRESFGLVCAEAHAHGCPVIATHIDGIPEVVRHMKTGVTIRPSLPLKDYHKYKGQIHGLPQFVYDPEDDRLLPPRFLKPHDIADAVEYIIDHPSLYEQMSINALQLMKSNFRYQDHITKLMTAIINKY